MSSKRHSRKVPFNLALALLFSLSAPLPSRSQSAAAGSPNDFLFQDVRNPVLFYGDDSTRQGMFAALIESYTLSRFPTWRLAFRNTGWEGDKLLGVPGRSFSRDQEIRRDIASFRPQMILVNYGINDAKDGDGGYQGFLVRLNILARDLPRVGVYRAAFISANPKEGYEEGMPAGSRDNIMLQKYMDGERHQLPISWKEGVDFMHAHPKGPELPLLQNGIYIDLLAPMLQFIEAGRKAGVLSPNATSDNNSRLTLDGVHPNWSGNFIMASLILEGLHAPDLVSSATLDAAGSATVSADGCTITWQNAPAGVVQFQRKDDALPWPVPPETDLAFKIPGFDPADALNRYELKVTGLKAPFYKLSIDGREIGVYSQASLGNGINLGFVRQGPIYDQGQKLLKAIIEKNETFFNRWHDVQIGQQSPPGTNLADIRKADMAHLEAVKPELARLDKVIADQEQSINLLRQPVPHVFTLEPAAGNPSP